MTLHVHKYGGTSVGSLDRIRAVAESVAMRRKSGDDVVVVVSAMAGETNRLETLGQELSERPKAREMDVLLSAGEQVSAALTAMALDQLGCKARSYLGWQVPIVTDSNHTKARFESIETKRLKEDLAACVTPVVAGFQGVDAGGDITTIGRGGSDTSAVAIAAALNADECRIYTDVDGVYTADPRIVDDAQKMDLISFEEMLELASLGSKVLHPRAVEYAANSGVTLRVLSSFNEGRGTLITFEDAKMEQPVVSGIAHAIDEAKLTVVGVPDVPGVASTILGPIADASIEVDMIVQNIGSDGTTDFTFTVKRRDYDTAKGILNGVIKDVGARDLIGDKAIVKVSVVGVGMRSHAGVATRMFNALAEENINIQMISTSEIKISVVIAERYLELAVRSIHKVFDLGNGNVAE
ncbi:aspartate kinase [Gammaproteobacteria bacterium]|nr:aspartate kinase [Gammaproteobacteria bacterium]